MIARYNGEPHTGLGYRSPLESLNYYINSGNIPPRQVPKSRRNNLKLLDIKLTRTVRGKAKSGISPHINYEGARYRNEVLSHSPDLIGKKLTLIVDPSNIHSVTAFLPNGAELGVLTAQGAWGRASHTLKMRKEILDLKYKKLIWYTESDDPVQIYMDYLGKRAIESKTARRKLASARQSQRTKNITENNSELECQSICKKQRKNSSKKDSSTRSIPKSKKSLPRLKTFTY
jgi:hypothetical protein